jgi:RNA polymerase sigma-70 factor (ECF subfamily)
MVYNVAFRIVGEGTAAEDITQEAFLAAYRAIHTLRGDSFQAWLLRIVTNRCRDEIRAARWRPVLSLDAPAVETDRLCYVADPGELPHQVVERRALDGALQQAILTLPPDRRMVLVLADVQGLTYQEVAEVLGISLGTVRSRLSRARAHLRDQLLGRREVLPAWVQWSGSAVSERASLRPITSGEAPPRSSRSRPWSDADRGKICDGKQTKGSPTAGA